MPQQFLLRPHWRSIKVLSVSQMSLYCLTSGYILVARSILLWVEALIVLRVYFYPEFGVFVCEFMRVSDGACGSYGLQSRSYRRL